jgi:hypothetical protein
MPRAASISSQAHENAPGRAHQLFFALARALLKEKSPQEKIQ